MKLYINATEMHSWEDGYKSSYPYKLVYSTHKGASQYNWCVGEIDVEVPEIDVDINFVTLCEIKGLEDAIKQTKADAFDSVERLQNKIDNLRALPAPTQCDAEVIEPDVTADDEDYFDQGFVEGEDY